MPRGKDFRIWSVCNGIDNLESRLHVFLGAFEKFVNILLCKVRWSARVNDARRARLRRAYQILVRPALRVFDIRLLVAVVREDPRVYLLAFVTRGALC